MRFLLLSIFIFSSFPLFSQENLPISEKTKTPDSIPSKEKDSLLDSEFTQKIVLDEVEIKKSKYDAVSLRIIPKEIKPLSLYERRLYTAGDFKAIHLLSILGGGMAVDPIINKISGRTKRLKKYIQVEKNIKHFEYILDHYRDYMIENLAIDEALLERFVDYLLANEKVPYLIENKVLGELPFIIGDEWFAFKALQEGEE